MRRVIHAAFSIVAVARMRILSVGLSRKRRSAVDSCSLLMDPLRSRRCHGFGTVDRGGMSEDPFPARTANGWSGGGRSVLFDYGHCLSGAGRELAPTEVHLVSRTWNGRDLRCWTPLTLRLGKLTPPHWRGQRLGLFSARERSTGQLRGNVAESRDLSRPWRWNFRAERSTTRT